MKKLSRVFLILAFILSHIMCAGVAFDYRGLICSIEHQGFSAPAETAFITAVPFMIAISVCLILARIFKKINSRS